MKKTFKIFGPHASRTAASIFILSFCIVAFLATAITVYVVQNYTGATKDDRVLYAVITDEERLETAFYAKGKELARADGVVAKRLTSFGGAWDAVLTTAGDLHLLYEDDAHRIASGVEDFVVASEGGALAYRTVDGSLYLCRTQLASPTLVTKNCVGGFVLSPRGTLVCYVTKGEEGILVHLWNSEDVVRRDLYITDGALPLAISDNGDHLYYLTSGESALYHASANGNVTKISGAFSDKYVPARFNRNLTEVLFSEMNAYTYFWSAAENKEKVASGIAVPVEQSGKETVSGGSFCIHSFHSFVERFYLVGQEEKKELRYLAHDFVAEKCAADAFDAHLSANGRELYLVRTWEDTLRIYHVETSKKAMENMIATGVCDYAIGKDGLEVYYITGGDKLYRHQKSGSVLLYEGAVSVFVAVDGQPFWKVKSEEVYDLYTWHGDAASCVARDVARTQTTSRGVYVLRTDAAPKWSFVIGSELGALGKQ
ncbi:MAG: hypothetical protein IKT43_04065 [Clostridia bacterium]|nr:hypothetical protein [Clostridia bacterium]